MVRRATEPIRVLGIALALMVAALVANLALHAWSAADDGVPEYMSTWGTERATAMLWSLHLVLTATASGLVASVAWRYSETRRMRLAAACMAAVAVGTFLVALLPADGRPGFSVQEGLHAAAATPAFLAVLAAPWTMSFAARGDSTWRSLHGVSRIATLAVLAGLVGLAVSKLFEAPTIGVMERIPVAVAIAWFAVVAVRLRRSISQGIVAALPEEPGS